MPLICTWLTVFYLNWKTMIDILRSMIATEEEDRAIHLEYYLIESDRLLVCC